MTEVLWELQGFEGPYDRVARAKLEHDELPANVVGLMVPSRGRPPMRWNVSGDRAMYAMLVRRGHRLDCPEGLEEAIPGIVGRLAGIE